MNSNQHTLNTSNFTNSRSIIIGLVLLFASNSLTAQNAFTTRTEKTSTGKTPNFEFNQVGYNDRNSSSFFQKSPAIENERLQLIKGTNGELVMIKSTINRVNKIAVDPQMTVTQFLEDFSAQLPFVNPNKELVLISSDKDELGSTKLKYTRHIDNIEVFGGEVLGNLSVEGQLVLSGKMYATPEKTQDAVIVKNEISAIALKAIGPVETMPPFEDEWKLAAGYGLRTKLYWASIDGHSLQKIYIVDYFPNYLDWYRVWIDASTGKVVRKYNRTCSIDGPRTATATDLNNQSRTLQTYQVGSNYYLIDASKPMFSSSRSTFPNNTVGTIRTLDAKNTSGSTLYHITSSSNTWTDKSAVSAHYNAGIAYDYYKNTHGRNSINGTGGSITSVVNVTEKGAAMDNAYWNGASMFYGNGKTAFKPLAGSLDVAGHEMTHGVVSSTANLEYFSQSGAINESMADVFGSMMDRDDWKIGEDVVRTSVFSSGALRDLSNPHNGATKLGQNGYQPKKMSEYDTREEDNQGVHINSGIPNHAYYLFATNITKEKAEKVYYRALTKYLTSSSEFLDLRYAVVQATSDLYGANSTEVTRAKEAFDAVEIYDPNAGPTGGSQDDLPKNTGNEFIISVNVDPFISSTLYQSTVTGTNFKALSKTDLLRRPSIVDDGSYCVFVANDNNVHQVILKGTLKENVLTSDAFWDNVAISKDGKRLAAVSTEVDSAIYVYDFATKKWTQFDLYNPTFSTGINGGGVLYADAIEFDYSGEYILYDARTKTKGASGADLDYWDIGVIRVWDNKANNWGDGKVKKLISQLPANVSIGNPTYAKNAPYIISFDYIDEFANTYSIKSLNTSTGEVGTIFDNTRLGFPNYSNSDDKVLFNATSSGNEVIGVRSLASDKINGTGTATLVIDEAKWGSWYADGTRALLSSGKDILSFSLPGLVGAPKATISGFNITMEVPAGTDLSSLTPSFTHSAKAKVFVGSNEQISNVTTNNFTSTVVYFVQAEDKTSKSYSVKITSKSVGISEVEVRDHIIQPNPVQSELMISNIVEPSKYELFAIDGRLVGRGLYSPQSTLDVSDIQSGLYYINLHLKEGDVQMKFFKE